MTVWVDDMRREGRAHRGGNRSITGRWSHLIADEPDELRDFVASLGLRPEWVQRPGTPTEHYDVAEPARRRAIAAGAVPISYPLGSDHVFATKRLQTAALTAARYGWHLFPLRPGAKAPAVRDWERFATADPERIRELWTVRMHRDGHHIREPHNIGIACGPSGLVVVDLDLAKPGQDRTRWPEHWRNLQIAAGADALAHLAEQAGEQMPHTYSVTTPSGGQHLYFTAPAGEQVRNSTGRLGPMIDIRGEGGYVVAAGSQLHLHPTNGAAATGALAYRVTQDQPPADLPGWLTDASTAGRQGEPDRPAGPTRSGAASAVHDGYGAAALRGEAERVRSAPVGQRNHTLNAAAYSLGQLVAAGAVDQTRAVEVLTDAAQAAGLTTPEIAATIDSGLTAGAKNPRVPQQPQTRSSREGAHPPPAVDEQQQQASGTDRQTDYESALAALDRAFNQAPAVAVDTATRMVTDAAPDERAALLREAATRIARLVPLDGIDGQSALDALTTAAGRVGMARTEIEAAISAGFARSHDPADMDDNRPPLATSDRSEPAPGQGRPNAGVEPVDAQQPLANEQGDRAAAATIEPGSAGADTQADQTADPPYVIYEVDAAHAGWLFAEAWDSFWTERRPCYPADTLRIACEGERLPTLGKSDRRFAPRPRAAFNEAPGEDLVHRDVWYSWSQSQRDEWYFARHERAQAAAIGDQGHALLERPENTDQIAGEPGKSDRFAGGGGAVIEGVATSPPTHEGTAVADLDRLGDLISAALDTAFRKGQASARADVAREAATGKAHGDALVAPWDGFPEIKQHAQEEGTSRTSARHIPASALPEARREPPSDRRRVGEVVPHDEVAPGRTSEPHVVLDESIEVARAAVARLDTTRAASRHKSRDDSSDTALHNDRPAYWAEPEVDL